MQFGLIGKSLSHSYSPEIHKRIADYNYELLEIPEKDLKDFFKTRNFKGINVTIPYKEAVIPLLDGISDNAKKIGAVNTVVNKNGKLFGYNTDFKGLMALFEHNGISVRGKKAVILGTGGTSKTAFAVLESLGADKIIFVSRSAKPDCITYDELYKNHSDAEIIVNTTPSGMFPNSDSTPVCIDGFARLEAVIDAVYNPLRTNLVLNARKRNITASGGLYMLSAQAVYACELFTDTKQADSKIKDAYEYVKGQKENIVLTGMPSSGKTTIGKLLSDKLERDFFDSDEEIIKIIKMPIRKFFEKYGEAEFRKIEKGVISSLSQKSGVVIATGGGAVLDGENVLALKRNGKLIFLNRSTENLTPTSDRPLSSEKSSLIQMFSVRYPIYQKAADIEISADGTQKDVLRTVLKELSL
ncbi:MAG: shikimate dehydrogenase [Firmicutes bacterium]|nr:shikimate dehydrogenase [Bacillota bacterium]